MEARDIIEKKFNKGLNGYKMEEVDDFLQEVSAEVANLKKQNEELEKKMEVLADKIREYRNDEDAIKEALLDAQKQSKTVQASAKEKSDKMVSDAKEKSEKMIKDAEEKVKEKDAYAKKLVDDANAEKTKIIAECERKSAEIKANMDAETKKQESIIAKTREESNAYVAKLLKAYEEHIALIKAIPGKCHFDVFNQNIILGRTARIKILFDEYEGIRIPSSAVHFDKEEQMGVFVKLGVNVYFKKIDVVRTEGDYMLVKDTTSKNGYLSLYDSVITEGSDLYDGKIII